MGRRFPYQIGNIVVRAQTHTCTHTRATAQPLNLSMWIEESVWCCCGSLSPSLAHIHTPPTSQKITRTHIVGRGRGDAPLLPGQGPVPPGLLPGPERAGARQRHGSRYVGVHACAFVCVCGSHNFGIDSLLSPNANQPTNPTQPNKTVGITLAMLGARVVLTDLPDALDILRHNVDRCFTPEALATLRSVCLFFFLWVIWLFGTCLERGGGKDDDGVARSVGRSDGRSVPFPHLHR